MTGTLVTAIRRAAAKRDARSAYGFFDDMVATGAGGAISEKEAGSTFGALSSHRGRITYPITERAA